MSALGRLFRAERVKLRKSWPMLTAILAPACQAAFLGLIFWFSQNRFQPFKPGFRFWLELNYASWNLVLMPIATALLCELSWDQEREARSWNLLLIQPAPRYAHYLAKLCGHLALILAAQALLAVLLLLGGLALRTRPELLMGPLPLALLLRLAAFSALASLAVAAFQTWLSLHGAGLWTALVAALLGSWLAVQGLGHPILVQFLPWGLAGHMAQVFDRWRPLPWPASLGSLVLAGLLIALGSLDFHHRRAQKD